ncbi:glycosyltransferase family 4 protein [bacterium]|nr:glycosyltransferase family 4 protein [bacterium]
MKIVYFNYMWDLWGTCIGSTVKALELLRALEGSGHEIKQYWRQDDLDNRVPKSEQQEAGSTGRVWLKKNFSRYLHEPSQLMKNRRFIGEELEILAAEKPDLVISRSQSYLCTAPQVKKISRIPLLIEADSPGAYELFEFQKYYRSTKWLVNKLEVDHILAGDGAFTVSNQIKQHFVDKGIPADFLRVIPNGADPDLFHPDTPCEDIKDEYELNDNVVVGFVGSFIFWHGIENLMSVIKKTLQRFENVKFLMVGKGGPMEQKLRDFIDENKFEDRVILPGFVNHDQVPRYISAMDIVLAPYPDLDFFYYSPVKIYEYMSCGKAVISTAVGQIAEIITDGENGFLTRPNDIGQITDIIAELTRNAALRKSAGDSARAFIEKEASWKKRGEQLSALCEIIASK